MLSQRFVCLFALVVVCGSSSGCVERYFVVQSNPPGAMVYVNNVPYSPTPAVVPYTYYGTYNIQLVRDGYRTLNVQEKISAPWYAYPPIDFAAEVIYPFRIEDIRRYSYDMQAIQRPETNALLQEAAEIRVQGKALPEPKYPPESPRTGRRNTPPTASAVPGPDPVRPIDEPSDPLPPVPGIPARPSAGTGPKTRRTRTRFTSSRATPRG